MGRLAKFKEKLLHRPSDGTHSFRLGQRRIYIIPTRAGFLFAGTLFVMLIGAINYALALGHALVFLLAGLGMSGMLHTFRNLYGLIITPGRCEPVFAGETAHFTLTLDNQSRHARPALELSAYGQNSVAAAVDRATTCTIAIPVATTRRGWLELPRIRLSTVYPLGLFVAWSQLRPAMRCLVYPQPRFTPLPPPSPTSRNSGRHEAGGDDDFAGFRPHQPADSPRHVAWKASARSPDAAALLVKQFAGGVERELLFDWASTASGLSNEERLSQLAGWVVTAAAEGRRYGLHLPDGTIPPADGEAQRRRCLEALALCTA